MTESKHLAAVRRTGLKKYLHFHYRKKKNNLKIITLKKILDKVVELVGGGSVINGAYPV